jgi:aryl-alcohol dehydrogenase-like predicted oxidoreductase
MERTTQSSAGVFMIGGELPVSRLGFGGLHLTGAQEWGFPSDRAAAVALLRELPRLGVNFIDTADSYGPDASEILIHEALHPYTGIVVATKAGLVRPTPEQWVVDGRPEHLIKQAKRSLEKLGVERIDLWQLHRIDPSVPMDEQFGAVRWLLDEGLIRHAGLSEVSVDQIRAAQRWFPVATVQNLYNLAQRRSEGIVRFCEQEGIGFIPWHPLASGGLAEPGSVLDTLAIRKRATPGQIAIAWLLQRSPVILPIPGSTRLSHVEQNMAAAEVSLDPAEMDMLNRLVPA